MKFYATVCRDGHKVSNTLIPKNQKMRVRLNPVPIGVLKNV